jgi:hypothetical protein
MSYSKDDGLGQTNIKSTTPAGSVDKGVRGDVPGGESKKGSHIKIEGPNSKKK